MHPPKQDLEFQLKDTLARIEALKSAQSGSEDVRPRISMTCHYRELKPRLYCSDWATLKSRIKARIKSKSEAYEKDGNGTGKLP